ncbi:hypothetical protein [Ferrimonas marina]|uniref:Uncharacterized protein n=1 Tax=Ferrimonas marina TaxID=299255 RepID=A0A1M5YQL2_9GAMM|nr:hypothetical protein [Ferrimonas marina]SHI14375.1 hypothetical protein SAMN02745129_4308 [Ferrimonas marina]
MKRQSPPPVCPMAALRGCPRCPIYKVCLPKYVIGDTPLPKGGSRPKGR